MRRRQARRARARSARTTGGSTRRPARRRPSGCTSAARRSSPPVARKPARRRAASMMVAATWRSLSPLELEVLPAALGRDGPERRAIEHREVRTRRSHDARRERVAVERRLRDETAVRRADADHVHRDVVRAGESAAPWQSRRSTPGRRRRARTPCRWASGRSAPRPSPRAARPSGCRARCWCPTWCRPAAETATRTADGRGRRRTCSGRS